MGALCVADLADGELALLYLVFEGLLEDFSAEEVASDPEETVDAESGSAPRQVLQRPVVQAEYGDILSWVYLDLLFKLDL